MPEENVPRFSEIGIMLPTGEDVDKLYAEWQAQTTIEINVLKEPYTDIFTHLSHQRSRRPYYSCLSTRLN
ncbi:hypothetical protein GCM10023261_03910 [Bartonella jaculi]|uniref:Uncharacterized protein n=1 Tax=Bartonella jaculi TaxID=686226 RepID=A0ABP9N178_9HYPH